MLLLPFQSMGLLLGQAQGLQHCDSAPNASLQSPNQSP